MNKNPYYKTRKISNIFLHVNEYGDFLFSPLKKISCVKSSKSSFFNDYLDIEAVLSSWSKRFNGNWQGPHTHIISLTARCINSCSYCCASCAEEGRDMSFNTAEKVIDFIFQIPQKEYFIEFTGGEPALNFEVLKKTVLYARSEAERKNKKVFFSIVTSLAYADDKILNFFIENKITVCSSLDGPRDIHDKNRLMASGRSGFKYILSNMKKLNSALKKGKIEPPNLITTVTSASLRREKDIVDLYLSLGVNRVQLGMLEPIGRARLRKDLFISENQYLDFYRKALLYMLELNLKRGIFVYEKGLYLILYDILSGFANSKRSLDVFHRLAYSADGKIYPSDEARILGGGGDDIMALGHVKKDSFRQIIQKPETRFFLAYNLNAYLSPLCFRCPYSLWCRVPIWHNYSAQNSLWGNMITSGRCRIMKGIFDLAFEILFSAKYRKAAESWIQNAQ